MAHPAMVRLLLVGLWLSLSSCAAPGAERVAARYAASLREGRLEEAYGLTSASWRAQVSQAEFSARYQDPATRHARADDIERSLADLKATTPALALLREEGGWRVAQEPLPATAGEVLEDFLDAAQRGDFHRCYALLAPSWRARYTPERLAQDFAGEPSARDRLARARAALQAGPRPTEGGVEYPLGEGKAVRLVREGTGYALAALE